MLSNYFSPHLFADISNDLKTPQKVNFVAITISPHLFADISNDLKTPQKVNFVAITMSGKF